MDLRGFAGRLRDRGRGPASVSLDSDFDALKTHGIGTFAPALAKTKAECAPSDFPWYPYDSIGNLNLLDGLLTGANRNLSKLAPRRLVADIGAGDGDLAFYLESLGLNVDIVDHGPTNFNGLRGARQLKEALDSSVEIHDVDLDAKFEMPRQDYDLVFFLGILYHLKNPYYAMEALGRSTRRCVVSTRVARFAGESNTSIRDLPVAYLLDPLECNNDSTNYWIFAEAGLRRLFARTGWRMDDFKTFGDTSTSEPAAQDRDERVFCLLSRDPG